jgi:hypothetical protein
METNLQLWQPKKKKVALIFGDHIWSRKTSFQKSGETDS